MKVYEYLPDGDRFAVLGPVSTKTFSRLRTLGSDPVTNWTRPRLKWITGGASTDFPYLTPRIPVVSDAALRTLRTFFGKVDVLDVMVPGLAKSEEKKCYHALHVRELVDCLDVERSNANWLEPGLASAITTYEFDAQKLKGKHLFRIPQYAASAVYLSGELMQAIREEGLVGLAEDTLLWSR